MKLNRIRKLPGFAVQVARSFRRIVMSFFAEEY
jgi:hypothetical protein